MTELQWVIVVGIVFGLIGWLGRMTDKERKAGERFHDHNY